MWFLATNRFAFKYLKSCHKTLLCIFILLLLVCQGCHNKYRKLDGSNNRYLSSYGSGGWKSEARVLMGVGSFQSCEGESVPGSSPRFWQFLVFLGFCCITLISAFTLTWCSPVWDAPFCKDPTHIGCVAYSTPVWPHLNYIYCFYIRSYYEVLGLGLQHMNWGWGWGIQFSS